MPHTYTALECTDLAKSVNELKASGAAGFSVSMPYKSEIIQYIERSHFVRKFNSCNTVVIREGKLHGYTADYFGALHLRKIIPLGSSIHILGNGNMGHMLDRVFNRQAIVFARQNLNWDMRHDEADVIINATACGTATPESPLYYIPPNTKMVIDLAIKDNELKEQCAREGVTYIPGLEFYKYQFLAQFRIYTGKKITAEDFDSI
jgi:shikimate 5-dehydrogenase